MYMYTVDVLGLNSFIAEGRKSMAVLYDQWKMLRNDSLDYSLL